MSHHWNPLSKISEWAQRKSNQYLDRIIMDARAQAEKDSGVVHLKITLMELEASQDFDRRLGEIEPSDFENEDRE